MNVSNLEVFRALSNPNRVKILAKLMEEPRCITDLSKELGLSPPLVYINLKKLMKAGLIREGKRVVTKQSSNPPLIQVYYEAVDFKLEVTPSVVKAMAKEVTRG